MAAGPSNLYEKGEPQAEGLRFSAFYGLMMCNEGQTKRFSATSRYFFGRKSVMELWDLYDEHRAPLGRTHQRGLPLAPGEYHLAVIVVIVNSRGEVLLTRRSPEKAVCPGWWENTGGAVQAGETSRQAILRELEEETGLAPRPEELTLLLQEDCREGTHFDIYALTWEGEPEDIRLQAGETDAARWMPLAEWEQAAGMEGTLCPAQREPYKQELYRRIALYVRGRREF